MLLTFTLTQPVAGNLPMKTLLLGIDKQLSMVVVISYCHKLIVAFMHCVQWHTTIHHNIGNALTDIALHKFCFCLANHALLHSMHCSVRDKFIMHNISSYLLYVLYQRLVCIGHRPNKITAWAKTSFVLSLLPFNSFLEKLPSGILLFWRGSTTLLQQLESAIAWSLSVYMLSRGWAFHFIIDIIKRGRSHKWYVRGDYHRTPVCNCT